MMPIPLIATYRLQLNASFTLHDARARIPYLRGLGISHLYLSPVLTAREGSTHGYDVADPTQVSDALGGEDAFAALARDAHAAGLGIILDIVPNHMGVGPDNPYWDDLLRHGQASEYAAWFDVDWRAPSPRMSGRILVPVLGDTLDRVVARDEVGVTRVGDFLRVKYFEHHFPLDPATIAPGLAGMTTEQLGQWSLGENGRARLHALLDRQHYELAFWRTAQRDVNYRRFFDVNELISLRVEDEAVFDATHREVLRFVADGLVDGLRVDHVDGLLEPRRYLERLRAAVDARRPAGDAFPIYVEKILAADESLPGSWPVEGTTGYEFMTALEDTFIDPDGHAAIEQRYRGGRESFTFPAVALASKRRVLRSTLNADVRRIAPMLALLARRAKWVKRPIAAYAKAIVELVAALGAYRTYIDREHPHADDHDRAVLRRAIDAARAVAGVDEGAVSALEHAMLGEWRDADAATSRGRLTFVLRWQQITGPAAAKGVEDTALYAYAPLTSRNEVGGDPGLPVDGADHRLQARLAANAERYPRGLNATNTHDTKRSADARARIDALSEHDREWARALRAWRRRHRGLRQQVNGRGAPSRAEEDFILQALVGVWPLTSVRHDGELQARLTAYVQKSLREAKVSTSWTNPDDEYEAAIAAYVARLLDPVANAEFLAELRAFVALVAPQAMWNALGRLVVHLTAPGVPDIYQGDDLWFAALVDPDNRRPVDWEARDRLAAELNALPPGDDHLARWRDAMQVGELKMWITRELLALRRREHALFSAGGIAPVAVLGEHRARVLAFRRHHAGRDVLVLVARRTAAMADTPVGAAWGATAVDAGVEPPNGWRCAIHGTHHQARGGVIQLTEVFSALPIAVLVAG